jgi:hypothetical protein
MLKDTLLWRKNKKDKRMVEKFMCEMRNEDRGNKFGWKEDKRKLKGKKIFTKLQLQQN